MGGSGGGSSFGNLDDLKRRAQEELKGQQGRKNVFISFVAENLDEVNLLRGQSKNDLSEIEFNDWSVREPYDSERAEYIKSKITERIEKCSVTIVYVTDKTSSSPWVNWEIRKSLELGKKVVVVHKGNVAPKQLPDAIQKSQGKIDTIPWASLAAYLKTV